MTRLRLRPVDLAREHGLSPQAVRNYEDAGILPRADRTPYGYRVYTPLHAQALRTFVALVPGHGHAVATAILRAVNEGRADEALTLIDQSHAQLLEDRGTLTAVEQALGDLAVPEPPESAKARPVPIGALAHRLGVRPATLRAWERAGLLSPRRDPATGHRAYTAADVRDALLARQLRRAGHPLQRIGPLLSKVREAGGIGPLQDTLRELRARHDRRGRAMLTAAAELGRYLNEYGAGGTGGQDVPGGTGGRAGGSDGSRGAGASGG